MKRFIIVFASLVIGAALGLGAGYVTWHTATTNEQPIGDTSGKTTSGSTQQQTTTTTTTSRCSSKTLTASYADDQGGGAAGSSYGTLTFTNSSTETCTTGGYPGLSLVNSTGSTIGQAAERTTGSNPTSIKLTPSQTAHAKVRFTTAGASGQCVSGATSLKVFPPEDTGFLTTPTSHTTWCPGFSVGPLY